jgi:hypothetical protein
MMASGLPVVEIYRDNNLYDFPQNAVKLCEATPESIATGIMEVLSNNDVSISMGDAGRQFMSVRPLEKGFGQFEDAVDCLLTRDGFIEMRPQKMYHLSPVISTDTNLINIPSATSAHQPVDAHSWVAYLPRPIKSLLDKCYLLVRQLLN